MDDILKQRLVGALILVALGVVFWPIIFVEPGQRGSGELSGIPERPAVDTRSIEPPDLAGLRPSRPATVAREEAPDNPPPVPAEPEPPAPDPATTVVADATKASAAARPPVPEKKTERRTRSESPEKPELDADGVPIAWILQVASVSSADKAEQLRKELLAFDQKAYVKKVRRNDKQLYRVYIGPRFERAALEKMKAEVDTQFGVNTLIVRYFP